MMFLDGRACLYIEARGGISNLSLKREEKRLGVNVRLPTIT